MLLRRARIYLSLSLLIIECIMKAAYAAPPLRISGNPPNGTQYQPYSDTLSGNNGTTPYTWSLTAGSLPPGLLLVPSAPPSLTAVISGTPTLPGTYSFTVTLKDSSVPVQTDSNNISITISASNCAFVGSNIGGISFSSIDPSTSPGPILGTVTQQVLFTCKAGMAYTVTANPTSGWTINSGGNTIAYTPDFVAGGTGLGATPIALLGTNSQILLADYANAAGGIYSNTQPLTLTIGWAAAGGGSITATLPAGAVNGMVVNTCTFTSPGTLTFSIDPSISGTTSATISPDMLINCTRGATVTASASSQNGGASPAIKCTTPATCGMTRIPYTFKILNSNAWPVTIPSASITGFAGAGASLGLSGSVDSNDYVNASVGSYGDVETVTINY